MVSLKFNICQENNCRDISFIEETGRYSASNETGFGTPNTNVGDILTALLQSTSPSGVVYNTNLLLQGFPTISADMDQVINLNNQSLEDGAWKFTYIITYSYENPSGAITVETYSKTINKLFYCNSQCCVDNMLANLDIKDCDCCKDTKEFEDYLKTSVFLQALKEAAKCGDVDNFTSIKKIIDKLCKNSKCKTCN